MTFLIIFNTIYFFQALWPYCFQVLQTREKESNNITINAPSKRPCCMYAFSCNFHLKLYPLQATSLFDLSGVFLILEVSGSIALLCTYTSITCPCVSLSVCQVLSLVYPPQVSSQPLSSLSSHITTYLISLVTPQMPCVLNPSICHLW